MQPVSSKFNQLRSQPVNYPTKKVELVYKNQALALRGAAASCPDESSHYPSASVINGNRTHRNYGVAATDPGFDPLFPASNGWKSSYGERYTPTTLPDAAPKPWLVYRIAGATGGACSDAIVSGILHVTITPPTSAPFTPSFYQMNRSFGSGGMASNATGNTIETEVHWDTTKLITIGLQDGTYAAEVVFGAENIYLNGTWVAAGPATMDVYKITIKGTRITIVVDGVVVYDDPAGFYLIPATLSGSVSLKLATAAAPGTPDEFEVRYFNFNGGTEAVPQLKLDLGAIKTISEVRLYGHPTQALNQGVRVYYSTDDITYQLQRDYALLTQYGKGQPVSYGSSNGIGLVTLTQAVCFLRLAADIAARYLIVEFVAGSDGYARCLEIETAQILDVTKDLKGFTITASMTYNLKSYTARSAYLQLKNYDKTYSPDINPEMTPMVEIRAYSGYAQENVLTGIFYADEIVPSAGERSSTITLRDALKLPIQTQLAPGFFDSIKAEDAIEYLGNLVNWSSSRMALDTSLMTLVAWGPQKVNVYGEMQKIAQGIGLQSLYCDETGILQLRIKIATCASLPMTIRAGDKVIRTIAAGGFIYSLTAAGTIVQQSAVTGVQGWSVTLPGSPLGVDLVAHSNGQIYASVFVGGTTKLYRVDGGWTLMTGALPAAMLRSLNGLIVGYTFTEPTPGIPTPGNLHFYDPATGTDTDEGTAAGSHYAVSSWSGDFYTIADAGGAGPVQLYKRTGAATWTAITTFTTGYSYVGGYEFAGGLGYEYNGKLYITIANPSGDQLKLYSWNNTGTPALVYTHTTPAGCATSAACNAFAAWLGFGPSIGGIGNLGPVTMGAAAFDTTAGVLYFWQGDTEEPQSAGMGVYGYNVPLKQEQGYASIKYFTPPRNFGLLNGILYFSGLYTPALVIALRWPFTFGIAGFAFSYKDDLRALEQSISDQSAGESLIITKATITATPMQKQPGETIWTHPTLPFMMTPGIDVVITATWSDPIDVATLEAVWVPTIWGGNPIGVTLSNVTAYQATITISYAGPGGTPTITDVHLTAQPYKQGSALTESAPGDPLVQVDYGPREYELQNDYIPGNFTLAMIAAFYVARYGKPVTWIPKLQVALTPNIQLDDRVTIIEINTGTSGDYYVININHDLNACTTELGLVRI